MLGEIFIPNNPIIPKAALMFGTRQTRSTKKIETLSAIINHLLSKMLVLNNDFCDFKLKIQNNCVRPIAIKAKVLAAFSYSISDAYCCKL